MWLPVDASIWGALLNGCRIHGRMDLVENINEELRGISTDDTGYYTLLSNIYAKGGNWYESRKVRSRIEGMGLKKVPGYSTIEIDRKIYRFGAGDTSEWQMKDIYMFLEKFQSLAQEQGCDVECYMYDNRTEWINNTNWKSRLYGSSPFWMAPFEPLKRSHITFVTGKHLVWNQCVQSLFSIGCPFVSRQSSFMAEAAWMFRGGVPGLDASAEQSESANEDILMFFFQLDLATRVQYALNIEEYDIAQQLRNKIAEVEEEVIKQQQSKRGMSAKSEAQDKALSIIRLCSDLRNAIENEDYSLAAELRDEISKFEAESLAASAKALAHENVKYVFRLGQKVRHKIFGYRAIICGMDPVCCESSSWMENAQVKNLSRGSTQPFYQVLVDVRVEPDLLVAYVAEENLLTPDKPDKRRFDHPDISFLFYFYGMDSAGDFIPIKQLREKYNKPRHEIPFDPPTDEDGGKV